MDSLTVVDARLSEEAKKEPSPINWTTTLVTLWFLPAFVQFQNAIVVTVNYYSPPADSGYTYLHPNATDTGTYVKCNAPTTSYQGMIWAWGVFGLLLVFGIVMTIITLAIHARYHGWHKLIQRHGEHIDRHERLARATRRKEDERQRKKLLLPSDQTP